MEVLSVDYTKLLARAKNLCDECIKIKENLDKLIDTTENLDIFWDGDASTVFIVDINEDIAVMETLLYKIETNIKIITETIKGYQETEKIVNQIIGGMKL